MDEITDTRGMVNGSASVRWFQHAAELEKELAWFELVLRVRMDLHAGRESSFDSIYDVPEPAPLMHESMFANFIAHYEPSFAERVTVLLALVPHVRPELLDIFLAPNVPLNRGHTEFGGIRGQSHGGFLPTGETLLFVLSEGRMEKRFACLQLFDRDHYFARHNLLRLEMAAPGEPLYSGQLILADEIVDLLTHGQVRKPDFSRDFPARLLDTQMEWDDLVLAPATVEQIRELEAWIAHENALMNEWGLAKRLKPGYRCLFYGPPGTGKTLTATLLGKKFGRDVYRIDLAAIISKYIGETEKNLERIFDRAQHMNCILFFDEADALFGKRTSVSDAHDRYANQEVSYLLQRVEDYPGLTILASNMKSNMDDAFMRRFQALVHFPLPNATERHRLWKSSFSESSEMDRSVRLDELAAKYDLSGGAIVNVVRYASLMALQEKSRIIRRPNLIDGIRRELQKEGRTL